ncbi:hypothetical protein COW38_01105 [Candidatus Collierbacteria bacterium CG17_big_fil_post_rev_8_21_14_2_50_45_7]|uniref:Uncharacterized protein n=2 Tax=Candidatus Collieribacteriota TaxID=1752725 RepID=A0A2H0X105_9BACT|nr:MAG: hypothetical protein COT54_02445 [Candidatus Collierbacteria bacterium CG09_land_8_20_14_0_10_46_12]PIW08273.1 MAG: hypothetical protein COW38_01105 [Candidatus Collierbacteria bacterium CG17_big_fil_post_rev_8_21_14_2_50_45_7]
MIKFKEYFKKMCEENKTVFDEFQFIHDLYKDNKKANQVVFNEQGKNATYSARLSEKFWGEVRLRFPMIGFVGATVK